MIDWERPLISSGGYPVRFIMKVEGTEPYCYVVCAIRQHGEEFIELYDKYGKNFTGWSITNAPRSTVLYVNVYKVRNGYRLGSSYSSEELAKNAIRNNGQQWVKTIAIEIEHEED